jgi:hypothetical protein
MYLEMSKYIAISEQLTLHGSYDEPTYHSKARTTTACTRATNVNAHVYFEFGLYMIDLDFLVGKSFTA